MRLAKTPCSLVLGSPFSRGLTISPRVFGQAREAVPAVKRFAAGAGRSGLVTVHTSLGGFGRGGAAALI
jgi:hypothetical protein